MDDLAEIQRLAQALAHKLALEWNKPRHDTRLKSALYEADQAAQQSLRKVTEALTVRPLHDAEDSHAET